MVEVKIRTVGLDPRLNSPVVVLSPKNSDSDKVLPVWIGVYEAQAIIFELQGVVTKRPLTHDLILSSVKACGGIVTKVEITELRDEVFYAKIHLRQNGTNLEVDARPSDAIALALKAKVPIYVNKALFDLPQIISLSGGQGGAESINEESLRDRLRKMNPEDFGNYKL